MEEWKDIQGYKGYYQVSNEGRIKSLERKQSCYGGGYSTKKEKIIKYHFNRGYARVTLCVGRQKKNCFVHTLIAQAFIPNPENKPQINHINGKRGDNEISNLEWVTAKENINHAVKIGLIKRGELSKLAKIKDSDIKEIRDLRNATENMAVMSRTEVAKYYNISKQLVTDIVRGGRRFHLNTINHN